MSARRPLAMRSSAAGAAALCCLWLCLRGAAGNPACWVDSGVTREHCCDTKFGPEGNKGCWDQLFTYEFCCFDPDSTEKPAPLDVGNSQYPDCAASGVVLRHSGEHAIFADMSTHGSSGCFQNDCKLTDKFNAKDRGVCARLCAELEECTHWSFGVQGGSSRCFLRKSDEGRQQAPAQWSSGAKACGPPPLPHAFAARVAAESHALAACDSGKGDTCTDVLPAMNTWIFAIKHLKAASAGRLDPGSLHHIDQIYQDSCNLVNQVNGEYRPSDADFPRVVYNNRLIFNNFMDWLKQHPSVELDANDASLPTPLRTGELCGPTSCYDS